MTMKSDLLTDKASGLFEFDTPNSVACMTLFTRSDISSACSRRKYVPAQDFACISHSQGRIRINSAGKPVSAKVYTHTGALAATLHQNNAAIRALPPGSYVVVYSLGRQLIRKKVLIP